MSDQGREIGDGGGDEGGKGKTAGSRAGVVANEQQQLPLKQLRQSQLKQEQEQQQKDDPRVLDNVEFSALEDTDAGIDADYVLKRSPTMFK